MAVTWYVGRVYRQKVSVYNAAVSPRVLADPTTISVIVLAPSGTESTYTYPGAPATMTRVSTGVYYADHTITESGVVEDGGVAHQVRVVTTGAYPDANQTSFEVEANNVP